LARAVGGRIWYGAWVPAYVEDTIAAVATAPGVGAIAVLRVSGREARTIASRVVRGRRGSKLDLKESHRARVADLVDPITGETVDEVLVLPMLAPRSYTGEDTVEIHCHGGSQVPRLALRAILHAGARAARAGEFTERAFLNGRLDLCQAEAVADLIGAANETAAAVARSQLGGLLSTEVSGLREAVLDARALCEAHLDFPEDDLPPAALADLRSAVADARLRTASLASTYDRGRLLRDGIRTVLVGKPNVGKSSLLNALLGRERALVSEEPGTTRDFLEEPAAIGDVAVLLCDTAGMRPASDRVETAGIDRTRELVNAADLVMVVLDGSRPLDELDAQVLSETEASTARILLRNKSDLPPAWEASDGAGVRRRVNGGDVAVSPPIIDVSALAGTGIPVLCEAIRDAVARGGLEGPRERPVVTHERQHAALGEAIGFLAGAEDLLTGPEAELEIVALHLQHASSALEALLGLASDEEILDRIFRRFCIGK